MHPVRTSRFQRWSPKPDRGTVRLRPLALWNVLDLRQLARTRDIVALPVELGLPLQQAVFANILGPRTRSRLLVARDRELGLVLVQVAAEPDPDHWLVTRLLTSTKTDGPDFVVRWQSILEETIRLAGNCGVASVQALLPPAAPIVEAFERAGFQSFRLLTVMMARMLSPACGGDDRVRPQSSHDAWSVMRLYERVTPRPVQYAAWRGRGSWQPGRREGWRIRGFLLREEDPALAYCQVRSRRACHVLEVLADPQAIDRVSVLVRSALERSRVRSVDRVWALVPEDAVGLRAELESLGFRGVEQRVWWVRYTAQRSRARAMRTARALRELQEAVAAGVPVYSRFQREISLLAEAEVD